MWKKLVNLAIYISLCIGVPRDHQNSTPNLYKQGTTLIDEYRSDRGRPELQRDREGSSAVPILELWLETKISLEPRVRSKSLDLLRKPRAIIASLTPIWSVTFPNKRLSFVRPFSFFLIVFYTFCKYIHHR